jgi:predicted enzyme related to lactoylglutathione lyase
LLTDALAFGGFSVDDVQDAAEFYGETLGLNVSEENEPMSMLTLRVVGDTNILIYEKPEYAPATFTILNCPVDDAEEAVDELTRRGVSFERYDVKVIHRRAGPPIAWFRDPAGNILSVLEVS